MYALTISFPCRSISYEFEVAKMIFVAIHRGGKNANSFMRSLPLQWRRFHLTVAPDFL